MKTTKKALLLALCAVLLVVSTVFATMAYLTSTTQVVKNTFTVGDVEITLDEAKVDVYGENANGRTTTGNEYKLIPGHEYIKDPTVYVDSTSEKCYVYVEVINNIAAIEADKTIAAQMVELGWTQIAGTNVWYYNTAVDPSVAGADLNLEVFKTFTILDNAVVDGYVTATNANSYITIKACAIQADGFDDVLDAWNTGFGGTFPIA
jgi:predicted ribosomally synthesized peptide with SipW-like signal peptide